MTFFPLHGGSTRRFRVLFLVLALFVPASIASAGVFSFIGEFLSKGVQTFSHVATSQNVPLLSAIGGPDTDLRESDDLVIVDGHALLADAGPSGTILDLEEEATHGMISTYTVRQGDSLSEIANMFGVSVNTILWANNLTRSSTIRIGQELVILPVSGVAHTVKKGDTLQSIAKKYKATADDIIHFNGMDETGALAIDTVIVVPDGEMAIPVAAPRLTSTLRGAGGPAYEGYYLRPVTGARKTQGLHGYNGIDLGSSIGTAVLASAGGQVIVARAFGYNGGYGKYIVLSHDNGTQTLYGHLNDVYVAVGQTVFQGQIIGEVGNTGRSTGPHLHFEVRGAKNPF